MRNDIYVLDQLVTGADQVNVIDDGTGTDTIRIKGVYTATITIDLAYTVINGAPYAANSRYWSAQNASKLLVIYGQIENAVGSNGSEAISGNDLDNMLLGDQKQNGLGASDTIAGQGGADSIFGGAGNDLVQGQGDADALWGDAGTDTVLGGQGADTLMGGAGADLLDGGGDAGDTITYATSRRFVYLNLTAEGTSTGRSGDAQGDQITGIHNVIGSAGDDRIFFLDKDALPDGLTDNTVYGGAGRDRVALGGGDDRAIGGLGGDFLYGEAGDDTLQGDAGADVLSGGYGHDVLTGGTEADTFIFAAITTSTPDNPDIVTDFDATEGDLIDLRLIDAVRNGPGNQAFTLIAGDFTGIQGQLAMQQQGADLLLLGDTNGDGQAEFTILLRQSGLLDPSAFLL